MATMQVAPQQPQPPVGPGYGMDTSPSSRRQYQQQSPQPGEHGRSPSNPRSSPHSSSRRPSRRPSGNANGDISRHTPHQSPPSTYTNNSGNQQSPISPNPSSQQHRRDQRTPQALTGGPPISPPPRTSSNQRDPRNDLPLVDRTIVSQDPGQIDTPTTTDPDPQDSSITSTNVSRSRRRGPASPEGPQRATSVREPGSHASPIPAPNRSTTQVISTPPSSRGQRDEGQVINRKVVDDDPAIDLRREEERQKESVPGLAVTNNAELEAPRSTPRSRQDYSGARRKEAKFGSYVLGQTLGEGEFGKVKLGWKRDGSVQVAIKLIRRESLGSNPSRLPKIHREISILETLQHPNIVKLHEMVETREYIGIILEYASGGELFDYILNHRYLKDHTARKLFAQLVSGVGYLHKKGIVHRDLKLENLLLDRNRNIIITDFGFANTFDPVDELGEEIESNLTNRDYVKKTGLDRIANGVRRGDLMATSCGSPCYAAPELVVTDSLYTGRKVDVWSCGVILYAMLAGYLPFDDDPANPEGDNINLLYKYITSTALTFPEYVTPHARDLLRRILVPDPRQRADLFEVARHSWLADYAHVVAQVTSSATTVGDISNAVVTSAQQETPSLVRSASVREPARAIPATLAPVGGLNHPGKINSTPPPDQSKASRDSKRRTVQVEYVAPQSQTAREGLSPITSPTVETATSAAGRSRAAAEGPKSPRPPQSYYPQSSGSRPQTRPGSSSQDMGPPPERPPKDYPRSVSETPGAYGQTTPNRPTTGSSMTTPGHSRLPSRGNSYSQPLAPTVATMNAQGRVTQPKTGNKQYNISAPIPQTEPYGQVESIGRPSTQPYEPPTLVSRREPPKGGHKRSNTLGNFFRTGSISGPRSQPQSPREGPREKRYPPTSMKEPVPMETPRQSSDSRRPSFGFGRKSSDLSKQEKPRRFSLLPASFSLKSFTGGAGAKDPNDQPASQRRQSASVGQSPSSRPSTRPQTIAVSEPQTGRIDQPTTNYDGSRDRAAARSGGQRERRIPDKPNLPPPPSFGQQGQSYLGTPTESEISLSRRQQRPNYPPGFGDESYEDPASPPAQRRPPRGPGVLQKPNRKFTDAYDQDQEGVSGGHHAGTSGAARRVMDFFRRRGRARAGEERV